MSTAASSFFRCRICGHAQYSPVRIQRPTGAWEATTYWKCLCCSVMFVDPRSFSIPGDPATDEASTAKAFSTVS